MSLIDLGSLVSEISPITFLRSRAKVRHSEIKIRNVRTPV